MFYSDSYCFTMVVAFLNAGTVVLIVILAFLNAGPIVVALIPVCFTMIPTCLSADIVVLIMILAFLSADTIVFTVIPTSSGADQGLKLQLCVRIDACASSALSSPLARLAI